MKNLSVTPLLIIFLISACSRKEVNVREHIQNNPADPIVKIAAQEEEYKNNEIYKNREAISKVLEKKSSSEADRYLKAYFDQYIQSMFYTENKYSSEVKSVTTDLINQLIMLSSNKAMYKEKLLTVVFKGCDTEMKGCVKYNLYPKVRSSLSLIIEDIKEKDFTPESAAKLLYVLQNFRGTPDPELFLLIMENQEDLNKYLQRHGSLDHEGASIVDLAIRQVKTKSDSDPEFKKRYCESALDSDIVASLESPLNTHSKKSKTLEIMVYCSENIGSIYDKFKARLDAEIKSDEDSFLSRYNKLPNDFFTRFGVKKDILKIATSDGYLELFVIDRYFSERLSPSVAFDLIRKFGRLDDYKFLKLFEKYIESFFAFRSETSFISLATELQSSIVENKGLTSSVLVDVTQNVAKKNFDLWVEAAKRFGRLDGLINQLFASKVNSSSFEKKTRNLYFSLVRKLKKNAFEETVKQNVEQPMQLFLNYFLSLLKGQAKFYFSWSSSVDKYSSFDVSNSLVSFVQAGNSIQAAWAFFQFTSSAALRLTPVKVKSAFYKASKLGLFEKIPFSIEDIKKKKKANYLENVKLLLTQLYDDDLDASGLSTHAKKYRELERRYYARSKEGIRNIKKYCADPFNSFFETELGGLNTRVSLYSHTASDKAPLVFKAYGEATDASFWESWVGDKTRLLTYAEILGLGKPKHAKAIREFSIKTLKTYEAPLIKMAVLKKELKDEILGTKCLKKIVKIERFKTFFLYNEMDEYFKQIYLVSHVSKKMTELTEIAKSDLDSAITEVVNGLDLAAQEKILKDQVAHLFNTPVAQELFDMNTTKTKLTQKGVQSFLKLSISPHNRETLGNNIGYQVEGAPTVKESKNFVLPNFFNVVGDTVTFAKWDIYLKVRDLMQNAEYEDDSNPDIWPETGPLFAQLLFDLGGQRSIETLASSYDSNKVDLDFTEDFEEFMKKAKREVFGVDQGHYLTWFKSGGSAADEKIKLYGLNYETALKNFKIGSYPLEENWVENCFNMANDKRPLIPQGLHFANNKTNPSCKLDASNADYLINEFIDFVHFAKLQEEDLMVIDDLGSQTILGEDLKTELFVKGIRSNEWRWFDNLYYLNFAVIQFSSQTGVPVVVDSTPMGYQITNFINETEATLKPNNHIFFHQELYQYLRDEIRLMHFEKMDKILRVENAIFKVEKSRKLGDVPIEIAINRRDKEILLPSKEVFPSFPDLGKLRVLRAPLLPDGDGKTYEYLSRTGPYRSFWGNYELFYEKQSDCFLLPQKGDFDAKYFSDMVGKEGSCLARSKDFIKRLRNKERGFNDLVQSL